jgi:hypothetical protein
LKAELLSAIQFQERNQFYSITLVATILSYAVTNAQPWPCLLAWCLTMYFWRAFRNQFSAMHKIGRYIAEFLEPESISLKWERRLPLADAIAGNWGHSAFRQGRLHKALDAIMVPHAVLSLSCLLAIVGLFLAPHWDGRVILVVCGLVVVVHSVAVWRILRRPQLTEREHWDKVFKEVKKKELNETVLGSPPTPFHPPVPQVPPPPRDLV